MLTRILSPSFTNGGTWTTSPVSSVAGFTWKKDIQDNSEKLTDALTNIDALRGQLDKTQTALRDSEAARLRLVSQVRETAPADSPAAQAAQDAVPPVAKPLAAENATILQQSGVSARIFRERIDDNNSLIARAAQMRALPKQ